MADHSTNFDPVLLEQVRSADLIVVLAGAGVSAESGIPTFRDALSGLWSKYNPEHLATPEAFARDPRLVTRAVDSLKERVKQLESRK